MAQLANLVRVFSTTTGTSNITLGNTVPGYIAFSAASLSTSLILSYGISDGPNSEVGTSYYNSSGVLTSRTPSASTNGGAAISLSGNSQIYITALENDFISRSSASTDNALVRMNGTSGDMQGSPITCADTTGDLANTSGAGLDIEGTNTNDDASTGYKGEYMTASVPSTSAVSLVTATNSQLTSILLTAGDWDVWGTVTYSVTGITATQYHSMVSLTAAAPSDEGGGRAMQAYSATGASSTAGPIVQSGTRRFSLSASSSVYLLARALFTAGSASAYGAIFARRMR